MKCYNCDSEIQDWQDSCNSCGAVVKCCMNCAYYEQQYGGSGRCLKDHYESNLKARTYCSDFLMRP